MTYIYLNLSKSTTTAQKLQFIIVRRKFKIYISAISFERKPRKRRETTHATLFRRDTPNRWKGDLRKKKDEIFSPRLNTWPYIYIRIRCRLVPTHQGRFFLHYPSVCNTYSYRRISLLIVTKSFFFLKYFFNHLPLYILYPVLCN